MSQTLDYIGRWTTQRGSRPVRVANCSGAKVDPGYQMLRQATQGDVDFITGDYLAEMNLGDNAEAFASGSHEGFEPTAWDGLRQSLEVIAEKRIKVVINGGAHSPYKLAKKTRDLAKEKGLDLKLAYVEGDNLLEEMREMLRSNGELPQHLDSEGDGVQLAKGARAYLDQERKPLVSANAYLGARAIVKGLELGSDIVICGRVSDASLAIGAAWYWWSWSETDYDRLAGALVAGHLIECSGYVTGSNFSGFTDYDLKNFVDIAFGIAEIASDGTCVITKHDNTSGMVNEDTVICQFLYELQGAVYLNSDVKAVVSDIQVSAAGSNRVHVQGIRGAPPPPTTKLAIFYKAGYQSEYLLNATGYVSAALLYSLLCYLIQTRVIPTPQVIRMVIYTLQGTSAKWALQEKQTRHGLQQKGLADAFDILEFQQVGMPETNPRSQLRSTTYLRIFAQADSKEPLMELLRTLTDYAMQHYSGMCGALDHRTAFPLPFLAYYPAVYQQRDLDETVTILDTPSNKVSAGHPPRYEPVEPRRSHDTVSGSPPSTFGATKSARLGDLFLARSGDKGGNANFGIYPKRTLPPELQDRLWTWLRQFLSLARMQALIGDDWRAWYKLERVEFPRIRAVHFVVYGILGRGVSSAVGLDPLGKGFADYIRDKVVPVPASFLERADVGGAGLSPAGESGTAAEGYGQGFGRAVDGSVSMGEEGVDPGMGIAESLGRTVDSVVSSFRGL